MNKTKTSLLNFTNSYEIGQYLKFNKTLSEKDLDTLSDCFITVLQDDYQKKTAALNPHKVHYFEHFLDQKDYLILKNLLSRPTISNDTIVKLLDHFNQPHYLSRKIIPVLAVLKKNETDLDDLVKKLIGAMFGVNVRSTEYAVFAIKKIGESFKLNQNTIDFVFDSLAVESDERISRYRSTYFCMLLLKNPQIENFNLNIKIFAHLQAHYKILALQKCNLDLNGLTEIYTKSNNRLVKDKIGEYLEKTSVGQNILTDFGFLNLKKNNRILNLKIRRKIIKEIRNVETI